MCCETGTVGGDGFLLLCGGGCDGVCYWRVVEVLVFVNGLFCDFEIESEK